MSAVTTHATQLPVAESSCAPTARVSGSSDHGSDTEVPVKVAGDASEGEGEGDSEGRDMERPVLAVSTASVPEHTELVDATAELDNKQSPS